MKQSQHVINGSVMLCVYKNAGDNFCNAVQIQLGCGVGWGSSVCKAQSNILMQKAVAVLHHLAVTVW